MKNHIISIMSKCMLLLTVVSCNNDILEENPPFLTPDNSFNNPEGVAQGIAGLHQNVREIYYGGGRDPVLLTGLATDVGFFGEDPAGGTWQDYVANVNPTDGSVAKFWDEGYAIIQRANVLIDEITKTDEEIWQENQREIALAEARFFRAFVYRNLVILYGDVPLVTEPITSIKTDFVRDPVSDVYAQIEADLLYASENLPRPGQEDAPGRVTQGAAYHLLSEVYLAQEKFQAAVDAASTVINDYGYALMTSRFGTQLENDAFGEGDAYYDLFRYGNQNLAENTEAIWVIQIEPLVAGGGSNNGERAFGPSYFRMGNTPDGFPAILGEFRNGGYTGYSDLLGRPVSWCRPTNYMNYDVWKESGEEDTRNTFYNVKRDFFFDNPESIYDGQVIDFSLYPPEANRDPIRDTCQYIFPYFMKVASPLVHFTDPNRSGGGFHHVDKYAFRLAETYLFRAEGYLGLGNTTNAAADINVVRARANANPVAPNEVDMDYLLNERARELYTEEWRRLTLMRLDMLVERVEQYNNNPLRPGLNIQPYHRLLPIPQSQIDLNSEADFEQNPGYN